MIDDVSLFLWFKLVKMLHLGRFPSYLLFLKFKRVFIIINKNNQMEYKFILEVARHGARAPSVLYDYTAPGQDNFAAPMELS